MDNLTHSLVGALIGQAGPKRLTGLSMPALVIGANLPDIDATCTIYGTQSLAMRRGLTHGPIALVLLPLALAAILYGFDRWQARRGKRPAARPPVRFGWLFVLAFVACLTHPTLDWMNSYGIRLLEPFSSRLFYGDTLFIIDVWLWALLGLTTWWSLRKEKKTGGDWRAPAKITLCIAVAYMGANWLLSSVARDTAMISPPYPVRAIVNPVPLTSWQRDLLVQTADGTWYGSRWGLGTIPGEFAPLAPGGQCPARGSIAEAGGPDAAAFLFWARAPFLEPMAEGRGAMLRDARFAGFGGDRFSVALPGYACPARR
ncbi:hypothetical protein GCM10011371_02360 [Novosphingobium marinum]|uniref:Inner membrane protein n=1 Tax=Novosphingobium marinum TaxID=1514948 RepID=A0A7Y9XVH8_9SPHN|nr:metal-dependent hydrolase [Novosphingobium marinum]NYH93928.1 inner membrane protein [Novosphingobium marinum]GGC18361.1 hypothetical protein GCM10011371_02360 [Novosphingobium marinum]